MNTTTSFSRLSGIMFRVVPAVLVLLVGGCVTTEEVRDARQQDRNEIDNLRSDVNNLKNGMKGVESANEKLSSDMDSVKGGNAKEIAELRNQMIQLERNLKAIETANAKAREELAESLSKNIAEIMRKQYQSSSSSSGPKTGRTPAPVAAADEHVVGAGETLTQIARKYGVTVEALMKANNLSDPKIRQGQKLVIPK